MRSEKYEVSAPLTPAELELCYVTGLLKAVEQLGEKLHLGCSWMSDEAGDLEKAAAWVRRQIERAEAGLAPQEKRDELMACLLEPEVSKPF